MAAVGGPRRRGGRRDRRDDHQDASEAALRARRTGAVVVASVLACGYAGVLIVLAVMLTVDWSTGVGRVGHLAGNAANRGVAFFVVACVAGAAIIVAAALPPVLLLLPRRAARGGGVQP
ncbi:hypothetical protein [uncultured Leifsonia sp.]|uniref:hypothetical protein n=1 Tax=uncultured Leifsonia sp. TaxID=340359 RepID=UPI0025E74888|nr:hypothetical protein [uncultured Leifsonia sp.]